MKRLKELLAHKHLLLDTGVFIEFSKNKDSAELKEFFQEISDAPCGMITIDQVYCEYLQYAKDKNDYSELLDQATKLAPATFPKKEDLYFANQLYLAFKSKDENLAKKLSSVDLLLGATIARYGDGLFLATTNHRDFPTFLFDREFVFGFENRDGNIQNICIIRFNDDKFKNMMRSFE